jgi:hypothetical protein
MLETALIAIACYALLKVIGIAAGILADWWRWYLYSE